MNVAARIDNYLRSRGSPMAGHGADFVRAWRRTGVDPYQLVAIAGAETTFGKAGTGRPGQFGAFGVGPGRSYAGYGDAIMDAARTLKRGYYSEGRRTFETIAPKWVGSPQVSGYIATERLIYNQLGGGRKLSAAAGGKTPARRPANAQNGNQLVTQALPAVPNVQLPKITRAPYVHMAPPTQGIPAGQLAPAPGQAGAQARYRQYKAELPEYNRGVNRLAKALTPPPPTVAPLPGGGGGGGRLAKGGGAGVSGTAGQWPTGRKGAIIGTPYSGTHTLGNWQSDRAVDIGVPVGTPIVASRDGVVGRVDRSHHGDTGRFGGDAVYLNVPGDELWYKHLSRVVVRPGQRVRKGQVIGYSGTANGTAHLHFASKNRMPRSYVSF